MPPLSLSCASWRAIRRAKVALPLEVFEALHTRIREHDHSTATASISSRRTSTGRVFLTAERDPTIATPTSEDLDRYFVYYPGHVPYPLE